MTPLLEDGSLHLVYSNQNNIKENDKEVNVGYLVCKNSVTLAEILKEKDYLPTLTDFQGKQNYLAYLGKEAGQSI